MARRYRSALAVGVVLGLPVIAAVVVPGVQATAVAQCRAAFGSLNDGVCLDGPGAPAGPQVPWVNLGPTGAGPGITTPGLFPGQTITGPVVP